MFGYVKPQKSELKLREWELYNGIYCGLCKTMGKCTTTASRLTLNYDFVYLALIRMLLTETKPEIKQGRCLLHPLKKRMIAKSPDVLSFCAMANALLVYYNVKDDIADSKRLKKLLSLFAFPTARRMRKKAKPLSELESQITICLASLHQTESEKMDSIDKPAQYFGELLGQVFAFGLEGDKKRIAYEIGFHTGKWIYVADALDDCIKDEKNGDYNPLLLHFGSAEAVFEHIERIRETFNLELIGLGNAVELLPFSAFPEAEGLIKNIIYLGMPQTICILGQKGKRHLLEGRKP